MGEQFEKRVVEALANRYGSSAVVGVNKVIKRETGVEGEIDVVFFDGDDSSVSVGGAQPASTPYRAHQRRRDSHSLLPSSPSPPECARPEHDHGLDDPDLRHVPWLWLPLLKSFLASSSGS